MKELDRRLAKLEDAADRWLDRSGSLAARQAQRERLKVFARERVIEQIRSHLSPILEGTEPLIV